MHFEPDALMLEHEQSAPRHVGILRNRAGVQMVAAAEAHSTARRICPRGRRSCLVHIAPVTPQRFLDDLTFVTLVRSETS